MIIDAILDACDYGNAKNVDFKYIYNESMLFGFDSIGRALDFGTPNDLEKALTGYVAANYPYAEPKAINNGISVIVEQFTKRYF